MSGVMLRYIAVMLLCVAGSLAWLGTRGLNEPDEGRYAETAREMAAGNDILMPRLNGIPRIQKPPLSTWITALSIRLLGPNEWAARLPSAAAAVGTAALTMRIGRVIAGDSAGWLSGLVLFASVGFFGMARIVNTDMILAFFTTASSAALVSYVQGRRKWTLFLFYLCMGLGFLTKGPVALLFPCCAAALYIPALRKEAGHAPEMRPWLGGLFACAIGLWWFVVVCVKHPALVRYFLGYEVVERVAGSSHNRTQPVWWYVPVFAACFLPWTFFLAPAWDFLRSRHRTWWQRPDVRLFVGWIALPAAALSMVQSKLATYLLPLFPPASIALAALLEFGTSSRWFRLAMSAPAALAFIASACICVLPGFIMLAYGELPPVSPWFMLASPVLACAAALVYLAARHYPGQTRMNVSMAACLWVVIMSALSSQADALMMGGTASVKPLAMTIAGRRDARSVPIFVCDVRANGMEFYLGRFVSRTRTASDAILPLTEEELGRIVTNAAEKIEALARTPAFCVVKDARYAQDPAFKDWKIVNRAGTTLLISNESSVRRKRLAGEETARGEHSKPEHN